MRTRLLRLWRAQKIQPENTALETPIEHLANARQKKRCAGHLSRVELELAERVKRWQPPGGAARGTQGEGWNW